MKMRDIYYLDRSTGKIEKEPIYGKFFIEALYGSSILSTLCSFLVLPLVSRFSFFSRLYGRLQKGRKSREKIRSFIKKFNVDASEFAQLPEEFPSFNEFFIRKLKPSSRPLAIGPQIATLPVDGRHLFYPSLAKTSGFFVKGKKFDLRELLKDDLLFESYKTGSLVISRLCPSDYHRFHFPIDCTPGKPCAINGTLYSVNPIALRRNITILNENKRIITRLKSPRFGTVLFIEIGATFVGSIRQTYKPGRFYKKGEEKGYFQFGGSCVLMLFPKGAIAFDVDLVQASENGWEVKANMGESFGSALG